MKKRKIACILGICFMAATLQIGCGGASVSADKYAMTEESAAVAPMEEIYYENGMLTSGSSVELEDKEIIEDMEAAEDSSTDASKQRVEDTVERKLIKTVNLNLETENYDALMAGLEQEIEALGGYIEFKDAYHGNYNSRTNSYRNRYANITARIPAAKLDEFTKTVGEIGNITYESESVEDVTLKYVDLSSHKKMLLAEQERLMEL